MSKVDLTLVKRLVSELEAQLAVAEASKTEGSDPNTYIVEMAKGAGIANVISAEGTALVGDIALMVSTPKGKSLSDLLGPILGPGKLPNAN